MKQERLNDELTIVGLIILVSFVAYYLIRYVSITNELEERLLETKKIAIMLDKRLEKTEDRLDSSQEQIANLQKQLDENKKIDSIIKDIATYWDN